MGWADQIGRAHTCPSVRTSQGVLAPICLSAAELRTSWRRMATPRSRAALCGQRWGAGHQNSVLKPTAWEEVTILPGQIYLYPAGSLPPSTLKCSWPQLAAKADLSRLEKLEQQVDQALNEVTSVRARQVR